MKKIATLFLLLTGGLSMQAVQADDFDYYDQPCPVNYLSEQTMDQEFGDGTLDITRCLKKRKRVKVMYQVNVECKDSGCTAPYAIGNINNAIKDYEITHGMIRGEDYKIVAVVHSGGWPLVLDNTAANKHGTDNRFQGAVADLIAKGVDIYFCQNTARKKKVKTNQLIPGVKFVTSGVTAISDLQSGGFKYVQP